jgi:hypothetical protein
METRDKKSSSTASGGMIAEIEIEIEISEHNKEWKNHKPKPNHSYTETYDLVRDP